MVAESILSHGVNFWVRCASGNVYCLVVEPGTIRENLLALVVTFLWQLVLRIVRVGSPTCPNLVNDRKTHLTAMTDNQKDLHHICLWNIDDKIIKCRMNLEYHAPDTLITEVLACCSFLWRHLLDRFTAGKFFLALIMAFLWVEVLLMGRSRTRTVWVVLLYDIMHLIKSKLPNK